MGWDQWSGWDVAGTQAEVAFLMAMAVGLLAGVSVVLAGVRRELQPLQAAGICGWASLGLLLSAGYGFVSSYGRSDLVVLCIGDVAVVMACVIAFLDVWGRRRGNRLAALGVATFAVAVLLAAST